MLQREENGVDGLPEEFYTLRPAFPVMQRIISHENGEPCNHQDLKLNKAIASSDRIAMSEIERNVRQDIYALMQSQSRKISTRNSEKSQERSATPRVLQPKRIFSESHISTRKTFLARDTGRTCVLQRRRHPPTTSRLQRPVTASEASTTSRHVTTSPTSGVVTASPAVTSPQHVETAICSESLNIQPETTQVPDILEPAEPVVIDSSRSRPGSKYGDSGASGDDSSDQSSSDDDSSYDGSSSSSIKRSHSASNFFSAPVTCQSLEAVTQSSACATPAVFHLASVLVQRRDALEHAQNDPGDAEAREMCGTHNGLLLVGVSVGVVLGVAGVLLVQMMNTQEAPPTFFENLLLSVRHLWGVLTMS